jgi:hypothetical protein
MVAVEIARSSNRSQLAVAAPLHVLLELRGQGREIALAAVIGNNDEPV